MVKVRDKQSIFDITVQQFGQIDDVVQVSKDNDVSVSGVLSTNTDLVIDSDGQGNNDIKKAIIEQGLSMNNEVVEGGVLSFNDWFLTSISGLTQMYLNLHLFAVGNFANSDYWSSTEFNLNSARFKDFNTGTVGSGTKNSLFYVRASRRFVDNIGAYALRDTGPAGGLIYYIDGTTYYEAAPSDQSVSQVWSNIDAAYLGTTGSGIGTGPQNTLNIIGQAGHTTSAAKLCNDLVT